MKQIIIAIICLIFFCSGIGIGAPLPHYMKGLKQITGGTIQDQIDKVVELRRIYETEGLYNQSAEFYNNSETFYHYINGYKIEIILHNYIRYDKSTFLYHSQKGREFISEEEVQVVKDDLVKAIEEAVEFNYNLYYGLAERIKAKFRELLNVESLDMIRNMKVSNEEFTYGDVLGIKG